MSYAVAVRYRFTYTDTLIDSADVAVTAGDHVVVNTERGQEMALATRNTEPASSKDLLEEQGRHGTVVRVATEDDLARAADLAGKSSEATATFRQLIAQHELDMKPMHTEFLFDGEKAVFYFASEGRVDFRELVRELAAQYHVRIDMRQVGVRDEARLMGGLSHCGQELCCARLGGQFQPVTIRMAKEQDLSLNPSKISGLCGRLMCCLRYEFEAYKDFKTRAPKKGAMIETPEGLAKVVDFDTPRETVSLRFENGQNVIIPLGEMECSGNHQEGDGPCRPNCVSAEVLQAHMQGALDQAMSRVSGVERKLVDGEVETDALGRVDKSNRRKAASSEKQSGSKKGENGKTSQRKPRRRRSGGTNADSANDNKQTKQSSKQDKNAASQQQSTGSSRNRNRRNRAGSQSGNGTGAVRPGQNSSGAKRGNLNQGNNTGQQQGGAAFTPEAKQSNSQNRRKPRRRHPAQEKGQARQGDTKD